MWGLLFFLASSFAADSLHTFVAWRGEGQVYSDCDSPRRWPGRDFSICFDGNGSYDLDAVKKIEKTLLADVLVTLRKQRVNSLRFVCSEEFRYLRTARVFFPLDGRSGISVEMPCRLNTQEALDAWSAAYEFLRLSMEEKIASIIEAKEACARSQAECASFKTQMRGALLLQSSRFAGKALRGPKVSLIWGARSTGLILDADLEWLRERTKDWDKKIEDERDWFGDWLSSTTPHCAPPQLDASLCQRELTDVYSIMRRLGIFDPLAFQGIYIGPTVNTIRPATTILHNRLTDAEELTREAANLIRPDRTQEVRDSTSAAEWMRHVIGKTDGVIRISVREGGGKSMGYAENPIPYLECNFDYECLERAQILSDALSVLHSESKFEPNTCNRGKVLSFNGTSFEIEWTSTPGECNWGNR